MQIFLTNNSEIIAVDESEGFRKYYEERTHQRLVLALKGNSRTKILDFSSPVPKR